MERYQKIAGHKKWLRYAKQIKKLEKGRIYCCHDTSHLLDVARIAYINTLEGGLPFSKDVVYGAALLHDIGKVKQYKKKIPHEIAGAKKAGKILKDCGYTEEETALICHAILCHRRGGDKNREALARILYEADKKSRMCMFCKAAKKCNWTEEEKNSTVYD